MKFRKILLLFLLILCFQLISFADSNWVTLDKTQSEYPQLDMGGYKTWIYDKTDVQPASNYYLYFPSSEARAQNLPWVEKLNLLIRADLSEDLKVIYDIKQVGGTDYYSVGVKYNNYSLLFGDLNKYLFKNQESVLSGLLNGLSIGGKWQNWSANLIAPGQYSPNSSTRTLSNWYKFRNPEYHSELVANAYDDDPWLEFIGIDLGRYDIDEDSIRFFVDKTELFQNYNFYLVNGLILFPKYYNDSSIAKAEYLSKDGGKVEQEFNIKEFAKRRAFDVRVLDYSEKVAVDGVLLIRNVDYVIYKNVGLIVLNRPVPEDAEVRIDYNYAVSRAKQSVFGGEVGYKTSSWNEMGISYLSLKPSTLTINPYSYTVLGFYDDININENIFLNASILRSSGQAKTSISTTETGAATDLFAGFKNDKFKLLANYKSMDPYFASERKVRLNSTSKQDETGLYTEYSLNKSLRLFGGVTSQTTLETTRSFNSIGAAFEPSQDFLSQLDIRAGSGNSPTNSISLYQKAEIGKHLLCDVPKKSELIFKYSNNVASESTISEAELAWLNKFWSGLMCLFKYKYEINSQSVKTQTPYYRVGYEMGKLGLFVDYSTEQKRGGGISSDKNEQKIALLYEMPTKEYNPVLSKMVFGMEYLIAKNMDLIVSANDYEAKQFRFNGGFEF